MRILALDVGNRHIGVAMSDPLRLLASPLTTIERVGKTPQDAASDAAIDAVLDLATEHGVGEIVVGIPYLMSGRVGAQARITAAFAEALARRTSLPVTLVDERLSSVQAERLLAQGGASASQRKTRVDAAAAAVILQAYLDAAAR